MTPALVVPVLGRKLYPGASVALDFTRNIGRNTAVVRSPISTLSGWTFTRASTGYAETSGGQLVAFASGEPRVTDRGLLVEEARTNLCWQSQSFSTTWTVVNSVVSDNTTVAPDGTTTADTITSQNLGGTGSVGVNQSITVVAATVYTASCYVKPGADGWMYLAVNNMGALQVFMTYNCTGAGATGVGGANVTSSAITAIANGWYRISLTFTSDAADTSASISVRYAEGSGDTTINLDGTKSCIVWGAQLEAGAFPTSYIPTTSASATRQADVASITGLAMVNPLTMFAQFNRIAAPTALTGFMQLDVGASTDRQVLRSTTTNLLNAVVVTASSVAADVTVAGAMAAATTYKGAGRFALNSVQATRTGTLGTEDTSAAMPASLSVLRVGSETNGGNSANAYIEKLVIYPTAFTDAQLTAATT